METRPDATEVELVARGMATAVAPAGGLTPVQASLLGAITRAVTEIEIDYLALDPLGCEELAAVLAGRGPEYRRRIVHHMVLAELVLAPLPDEVAERVTAYAAALGIDDDFVRIARRYARGTLGLAWCDLRRSGFADRWDDDTKLEPLHAAAAAEDPFEETPLDPELAARWQAFGALPEGTLGRDVFEMYRARAFFWPGTRHAASPQLAQHDFVHVIADYGTTIEGELEVFGLIGRADPDPKGFAWLATVVGLFETGFVHQQGFFEVNVRERHLSTPGNEVRLADAIRRGKRVCEALDRDLLTVDYHELAPLPIGEVRERLHVPPKSPDAIAAGSAGPFEPGGISEFQREAAARERASGSTTP
ncbi:MAG TPA: hypothetical protein VFW06_01515 [Acidimicrobiia bacterium]|nr:hypothetical protein [Acidimicrobiia bacterium]